MSLPEFGSYATLTTSALTDRAKQISTELSKVGFIPAESFENPSVQLLGKSTRPYGNIGFDVCEYHFFYGAIYDIARSDLSRDRGTDGHFGDFVPLWPLLDICIHP